MHSKNRSGQMIIHYSLCKCTDAKFVYVVFKSILFSTKNCQLTSLLIKFWMWLFKITLPVIGSNKYTNDDLIIR